MEQEKREAAFASVRRMIFLAPQGTPLEEFMETWQMACPKEVIIRVLPSVEFDEIFPAEGDPALAEDQRLAAALTRTQFVRASSLPTPSALGAGAS